MYVKHFFLITLGIFLSFESIAQDRNDQFYDLRVKKLLDSKDVNYTISKNNNFKINLVTEDKPKERTQIVVIYSETSNYINYEIRDIRSSAFTIPKNETKSTVMLDLMKVNATLKSGSWSFYEYDATPDVYTVTFTVTVPVNISADDLYSMILLVGNEADRVEKLYKKGEDNY